MPLAAFALATGAGLGLLGSVTSMLGGSKQSKAEEEAAQAAALLALEQAAVDAARSRRSGAREIGSQRGQVARSGISIEGSQGDLLITNAFELELDAVLIERFGSQMASQENSRAKSIAKANQIGKVAGVLGIAASAGVAAYGAYGASSRAPTSTNSRSNPAAFGQGAGALQRQFGGTGGAGLFPGSS